VTDLAAELGGQIRALRVREAWTQEELADRANVALNVVRRLETGRGATTHGLLAVPKALGRVDWLKGLAPEVGISPLQALKSESRGPRQRVRAPRKP
jgi:transcriptional regulator with XRE-family HTH domain